MSPESLRKKTQQIIAEAKKETMKWRTPKKSDCVSSEHPRRRQILQAALDRASAQSRAAAAEALSVGEGVTQSQSTDCEEGKPPQKDAVLAARSRTTEEILQLANGALARSPVPSRIEYTDDEDLPNTHLTVISPLSNSGASLVRLSQSDDVKNSSSHDVKPPPSPMTPTAMPARAQSPHPDQKALPPTPIGTPGLSAADSTESLDDYEKAIDRLSNKLTKQVSGELPREKVLRRLDGIVYSPVGGATPPSPISSVACATTLQNVDDDSSIVSATPHTTSALHSSPSTTARTSVRTIKKVNKVKTVVIKSMEPRKEPDETSQASWFSFLWGDSSATNQKTEEKKHDDVFEGVIGPVLACAPMSNALHEDLPAISTSLVRVASKEAAEGYAEAVNAQEQFIDPRMPEWVDNQFSVRGGLPKDGTYQLGESRTVIVHELIRGNWTWCTAWSPDGKRLAVGTENHHLAIVDTFSSSVWRIKHDKKVSGLDRKGDTKHSIRSIAWGNQFLAIGGVGNSVSILAPTEPYPVLHTIQSTGFVGCLDWHTGTNTLLIASRVGKAMIAKIWAMEKPAPSHAVDSEKEIQSTIVHVIDRQQAWVNSAKFSPGGHALAVGDSKGILGVYSYEDQLGTPLSIANIANFKLEDSILDVSWSPDGQWLYAGGEDCVVTVINTQTWEAVHRIKRDRWVQFISSSNGGSHVALGGVSSEVSILDVDRGWDTAINVSLKGLVPLSAKWHPQDQYLIVTGQNNSILAVETTNARYVSGHFLRSVSPIMAIEFSPDGRMAAIGNESGVVTIFKLSGTTFISTYELVLDCDDALSIQWSRNGSYLAIIAGKKVVIVARSSSLPGSAPPNSSGFHVARVIREFEMVKDVAISPKSRYLALSGVKKTIILDATIDFKSVLEIHSEGITLANSWSPDGCWFATIGRKQSLLIYDTSYQNPRDWRVVFTVQTKQPGLALAWGPSMIGGLQYCAYGGEDKRVYIMEIRTKERTWETVLGIPREGSINDLDWNNEGLVAAAIGNGTVTVMDLSYLQSGWAVNEMDYNWQRQALTCFTEIRRNRGKNRMKCVRWIPSAPGSDSLLAVGGTDGEVEIVDLTDRQRCTGFTKNVAQ